MSLPELLNLLAIIPSFLFLSVIIPPTQVVFIGLWLFCLGFDLYTTHQFYLENPHQFQENERNKIFSTLTKKFGFKTATILFPITTEIPLLLFFATFPLQTLHTNIFPNTPNSFITCLATSFGIAAISHLQAAATNTKHNNKNQKHKNSNKPLAIPSLSKTIHRLYRFAKTRDLPNYTSAVYYLPQPAPDQTYTSATSNQA